MKPNIGVLNSGGDCAGLNAVISAIVKGGGDEFDFIGINYGLEGLIQEGTERPLTREDVRGIAHTGGTILTTTNKGEMGGKTKEGEVKTLDPSVIQRALQKYNGLGLQALIVIGGDGSLTSAMQLSEAGMNIVGVPKTIDNDLKATKRTFGFESAVEIVTESLDRIHTTAKSHERIMIVEVMGRHAGWIALHGGVAGGADVILIPELPFSYQNLVNVIKERDARGRRDTVIVVSEGAMCVDTGGPVYEQTDPSQTQGEYKLGGIAHQISDRLSRELPEHDNRYLTLGHVQRGGAPTSDDRVMAFMYGSYALQMVREHKFGQMATWDGKDLGAVPISEAVDGLKLVEPDNLLLNMARGAGIQFCEA